MENSSVFPGIHPSFGYENFDKEERLIIEAFAKEFYVTNAGKKIKFGPASEYKYILIKPTAVYAEMFNLDRDIIVVFSNYSDVEARTLDAFERAAKNHSTLRLEKICGVLVSRDRNVESSLESLVKAEPESQIVIPFFSGDIHKNGDSFFFRNKFRRYFYARDLFAFEAPLQKDLYFFGRVDIIQTLINRYKSGENSGVFGLRKTGKTSLINGFERTLFSEGVTPVIIDCQNTSFNQRRWNEGLYYLCLMAQKKLKTSSFTFEEKEFTEKDAAILFESFIEKIFHEKKQRILFIFDEVENISRKTSPAPHWKNGLDFVLFWQSLRSIFQNNKKILSYIIVGTNPSCVEVAKIENVDNPLFNHFTPIYIPGFEVDETRLMTRKLGRKMGIKFEETIYAKLSEDFGGHPFLMRHACSSISKSIEKSARPVMIDRLIYQKGKEDFLSNNINYMEMIVGVLKDHYNDEYEMLRLLAIGETKIFNEFSEMHPYYTNHLIGYGLIKNGVSGYDFCIDAVKNYILNQSQYKKISMSIEEKWSEISERRNRAEIKLRKLVKSLLRSHLSEVTARQAILDIFGGTRKQRLSAISYAQLFDPEVSEIYFSDLAKIISKHWDVFKNSISHSKKDMYERLEFINHSRAEAHASEISDEQFAYFRVCITAIENDLLEH